MLSRIALEVSQTCPQQHYVFGLLKDLASELEYKHLTLQIDVELFPRACSCGPTKCNNACYSKLQKQMCRLYALLCFSDYLVCMETSYYFPRKCICLLCNFTKTESLSLGCPDQIYCYSWDTGTVQDFHKHILTAYTLSATQVPRRLSLYPELAVMDKLSLCSINTTYFIYLLLYFWAHNIF